MKKIVIIGAGPAGLTAAYCLLKSKEKYEVIVIEESNQIGGISRTIRYNGNRMDIGGHRFFSKNDDVLKLWKELMPLQSSNNNPEQTDEVMLIRNRVSRIYYLRKFFDYPISLKKETFKNMGLPRTIKVGFSYLKSIFIKRKEKSLEDFYINRFGKKLYSMFFEKYTEKLWGRKPSQISADWGAQRVKGLSIKAVIKDIFNKKFNKKAEVETSLIEEFWYPKYGPGQLWELMAKKVEELGGTILKEHKVEKINIKKQRIVSVECDTNSGKKTIEGDIFISSMPLKDLVSGFEGEKVPNKIRNIAKGLPYRDFMTVGVLVNKLKIKDKTMVPDCWIYVQEPDVKMGRIQIFNNWSPYLVAKPENTVWMGLEYFVTENDKYWKMSDKDLSWETIYSYYYKRGLTMYILECLARITTSLVIAISPILLFGCLNWSNIPTARTISEVILPFSSGSWRISIMSQEPTSFQPQSPGITSTSPLTALGSMTA